MPHFLASEATAGSGPFVFGVFGDRRGRGSRASHEAQLASNLLSFRAFDFG